MTTTRTSDELARATRTVVSSWEGIAAGTAGASVVRGDGLVAAVFPAGPERDIYNNAILDPAHDRTTRPAAIDAAVALYGDAGVERFALWIHEHDDRLAGALAARGFHVSETTRAMAAPIARLDLSAAPGVAVAIGWPEYLGYLGGLGLPPALLAGAGPGVFHAVAVREGGRAVATGLSHDHGGDCGIYNISTSPAARRRGHATAVTVALLRAAQERGCATASLQATPMAEGLYARLGFRSLGVILEHA